MFVFQVTNAPRMQQAMTKAELASAVHDYIVSAKPVPYGGVPKLTPEQRAKLEMLADAAWKQYGFDQLKNPAKDKIRAAFTEEFIRTVYVQAGIFDFVKKKGSSGIEIKLNKGATATLNAGTYSSQVMSDLAAFTAINAAVKGRVGTMRDAYLADNIVLHAFTSSSLAEKAEGKDNPFYETVSGLGTLRPTGRRSEGLSQLSTLLDPDPKLKGAYNGVVNALPAKAEEIDSQFIAAGYKPTTKSGKLGNVELLFLSGLLKANEEIVKLTEGENVVEEKKVVLPTNENPQDQTPPKEERPTLGRLQLKIDSRALYDMVLRENKKIPLSRIMEVLPTRADFQPLKFQDPDKFFHTVFGRGKTVTIAAGGEQFTWTGANYSNLKQAVEFLAKHSSATQGGSYTAYSDGKAYNITYSPKTDGNVHSFAITVSPKDMSSMRVPFKTKPDESILAITGSYSRVEQQGTAGRPAGIFLNNANIEMRTGNLSASAYGSYVYDRNTGAVKNGKFGVKVDLGKEAHLYLEGADFNFVKGRFSSFALNRQDPLKSTFKIGDRLVSVYDVLHNKETWQLFKKEAGASFRSGYVSMDAGYGPVFVQLEKLDVKNLKTADRIALGLNNNGETTELAFKDNHFNWDGKTWSWQANGESMVSVEVPDLSDEQKGKIHAASKKFSDAIKKINPNRESIYVTIRNATRSFLRELYGTDFANTQVTLNLPAILGSFEDGSFIGNLAKNGIGPSLQKDLPNGGELTFTLGEINDLVVALGKKGKDERWVAVENAIRKKFGIQSGEVFMDNTVMSLYFGGFNTQQEIIDRAIEARGAMQLFLQQQTTGTAGWNRAGVAAVYPLMGDIERKEDFFMYAQLGAAMNEVGISVFGRPYDRSNINSVTKSVTIDLGVAARNNALHLDFGAYGTMDLPYQELVEVANQNGGNNFIIPIGGQKFEKAKFRGYLFGRYDPYDKKVQFTVIAGLVPGYAGRGKPDYENLKPKVGAQIKLDAPISVEMGGVKLSPDATILVPNVASANVFGSMGLNLEADVGRRVKLGARAGTDLMAGSEILPVWSPVFGLSAKTELLKGTDFSLEYRTQAREPLKFGVKAYIF